MHFRTVLVSLVVAGAAVANPQPNPNPNPQITLTAPPNPQQSAAISNALNGIEFGLVLGNGNEVASVTKALATAPEALQTLVQAALPNNAADFPQFVSAVNEIITGSPSGFNALPTDVQSFIQSIANQGASIVNNGGSSAPAPTSTNGAAARHVQFAAGLLGAGFVGAAML